MRKQYCISRWRVLILLIALGLWSGASLRAQPQAAAAPGGQYKVMVVEGLVEIARAGSQTFDAIQINSWLFIGDRVRIGPNGKLTIQRLDNSVYRFDKKTEFVILAPRSTASTSPAMQVLSGILYFLHRGKPELLEVLARRATAAVRGTEFELRVDETDTMVVTVIDGVVDLSNEVDSVAVQSGQQGIAEPGKAPVVRAAIDAVNIIQWTLYYPGILDVGEIPLTADERTALRSSIDAYRAGDLLRAVSEYPDGREPGSDAERVYRAGLFVAVGQIADAENLLRSVRTEAGGEGNVNWRLVGALRNVIAAVKMAQTETKATPELASEWLAESYQLQARADLEGGLRAARSAVSKSPNFGFGWARVAELEFSFGRIDAATEAIQKSLQLAPRNAQAMALNGFLFAARNKLDSARAAFEEAMAVDGRLANAWLGRGLVRIRKGDRDGGREDLLTAAALEPQRAFLRSYLGKAWADAGEKNLAEHELELAEQFDSRDPVASLYSALLKQQNNRINEAIEDLEKSRDKASNRRVYRAELQLDQDRAVRSANLAHIYRDAGMTDWSVREASRAVGQDYANFSAHLFLANSYDELRDPYRINLRYETPAESEYMIANLLAPVGAGPLSRSVSQGEYSKLFEANRFGAASTTEYLSRGAWYENGAQFGVFGGSAYSVEGIYRTDPGQRPNNDFEERDLRVQFKQQLTYKDSIFVRASQYESSSGDALQYYDPGFANPGVRTRERQEPVLTLGYHHEWNPEMHTLIVASRFDDTYWVQDPAQSSLFVIPDAPGLVYVEPINMGLSYRSRLELYTAEAQQIWQTASQTTTVGARFQKGDFNTFSFESNPIGTPTGYAASFIYGQTFENEFKTDFERLSFYGYHAWQIVDQLQLIGGLSYDRIMHPANFRAPPISDSTKTTDQISPKAGFIWTPPIGTTVRGSYTRSLSGASLDQSLTIEPSQVAGLNQSFRSLISESLVGSDIGAEFETFDLSLEHKFGSRTYVGLTGELLYSKNRRDVGVIALDPALSIGAQGLMRDAIDYRERNLIATVDQLLGQNWSAGVRYRLTDSRLDDFFPDVASGAMLEPPLRIQSSVRSTLHEVDLHVNAFLKCGFFAQGQAVWYGQSNRGYSSNEPGDSFWQVNAFVGYRFLQRRAEIGVALLNINDANYRLSPLTPYLELPRDRTLMVRLRLSL